ncbi:pest proteolytic signal-containing nuclear protein-like [Plakobranchus ocellatus]|uniref:PEST proteolytic signal-containing nuclear protein n=1 Tax=Plakobranchus ocellatus TaxID=259542 RepID=A0AAV3ZKB4_9GAST|nr:pest proteolytic signal-containing nuclear protein-like [Plakobranchus ocellatus]
MSDSNTTTSGTDSSSREEWESKSRAAEKRQSSEGTDDASSPKKVNISLAPKPTSGLNQKISFNLGGASKIKMAMPLAKSNQEKASVLPIKMSLGSSVQKSKDPPPVVQKSALAAKVFDEDEESDSEEMPPEAKMRMKNIGRNTPTASGPNSYGKGKHGFVDRQKIIERQLKEEMEKVSGDREAVTK